MDNIGCAHVYTYIYRSTVYYIYTFVDEPSRAGAQLLLRRWGWGAQLQKVDDETGKASRHLQRRAQGSVGEIASWLPSPAAGDGVGEEGNGCVCEVSRGGGGCVFMDVGRRAAAVYSLDGAAVLVTSTVRFGFLLRGKGAGREMWQLSSWLLSPQILWLWAM
jgi:hypothetical protein